MDLKEINIPEKKIKQLNKKKINTVRDMLYTFPRKYIDYSKCKTTLEATSGERCAMKLYLSETARNDTARIPFIKAYCMERETQREVIVIWFYKQYMYHEISELKGKEILVCGIYKDDGTPQFSMPDVFMEYDSNNLKIYPVYSKVAGMSDDYYRNVLLKAQEHIDEVVNEPLPDKLRTVTGVISEKEMVENYHFPKDVKGLTDAKRKEIVDVLYKYAVAMERDSMELERTSVFIPKFLDNCNKLISLLPYELTDDQKNIVKQFIETAKEGKRVNALIQGDVGSGKTVCAFLLMTAMSDNGFQSALMAPTGVLARQHFEELSGYAEKLGLTAVYLGSELKVKERREVLAKIESGEADFVVGTHSVISKDVVFKNLGLTIVDEEHKFGVIQRQTLKSKASEGVHSVSMSATPIPRSLALAVYGDALDIYTISTMPNGRKPVKTAVVNNEEDSFGFMLREIRCGHQCYIVCPLISADEKKELKDEGISLPKSVEEVYESACAYFGKYGINVGVITGKMKDVEKSSIIESYKKGEIKILVATTIIEVGVNVPNATVITIMNAERFGLAGLHQLRGRVGRSSLQSYCILESSELNNPRLEAMCKTTDGFKIAEEDLKLRGTGDLIGVKQSGSSETFAVVLKYPNLYSRVRKFVRTGE